MADINALNETRQAISKSLEKTLISGFTKSPQGVFIPTSGPGAMLKGIEASIKTLGENIESVIDTYKFFENEKLKIEKQKIDNEERRRKLDDIRRRESEEEALKPIANVKAKTTALPKLDENGDEKGPGFLSTFLATRAGRSLAEKIGGVASAVVGAEAVSAIASSSMMASITSLSGPMLTSIGGIVAGAIWMIVDGIRGAMKFGGASGFMGSLAGGMSKGIVGGFKNMGKWAMLGAGVGGLAGAAAGGIGAIPGALAGGLIGAAIGLVLGYIGGERLSKAFKPLDNILKNVWKFITLYTEQVISVFKLVWDVFASPFKSFIAFYEGYQRGGIVEAIKSFILSIGENFKVIWEDIKNIFNPKRWSGMFSAIWEIIAGSSKMILNLSGTLIEAAWSVIGFVYELINPLNWLEAIKQLAGQDSPAGRMIAQFQDFISPVTNLITDIFNNVKKWILENKIIRAIAEMFGIDLSKKGDTKTPNDKSTTKNKEATVTDNTKFDVTTQEPKKIKEREDKKLRLLEKQSDWLDKITNDMTSLSDSLFSIASGIGSGIGSAASSVGNTVTGAVSGVKGFARGAMDIVGGFLPQSTTKEQSKNQLMTYNAFRGAGFSEAQAKALTAEVGRENTYQSSYMFGRHIDPKNKTVNQGIFSWQGERRDRLVSYMKSKGLVDRDGNFLSTQESLQAQAEFAKREMETDPAYAKTKSQFLENRNIGQEEAALVLGRNYVRWAIDNPLYGASGQSRRRGHLANLEKQLSSEQNIRNWAFSVKTGRASFDGKIGQKVPAEIMDQVKAIIPSIQVTPEQKAQVIATEEKKVADERAKRHRRVSADHATTPVINKSIVNNNSTASTPVAKKPFRSNMDDKRLQKLNGDFSFNF